MLRAFSSVMRRYIAMSQVGADDLGETGVATTTFAIGRMGHDYKSVDRQEQLNKIGSIRQVVWSEILLTTQFTSILCKHLWQGCAPT